MIENNLTELGLSSSEIKVYLYLNKKGNSYANKISLETGVNRTNVYEALGRLINKGLVSFITKNKVKWYEASKPESIANILKEKEDNIENMKQKIPKIIDILYTLKENNTELEASIFVGKKGLKIILEEILQTRKQISLIASKLQFKEIFNNYFELWHKKRINLGITQRSIFPDIMKSKLKKRKLLEYRYIENGYINPTTTIIYGDNCLFIHWLEEPIIIKIKNDNIVKSQFNYFNILWNTAKK
ncbi:MAG: helix-turn-helix domain-containing protein [Nanoarchaeota archaeon]